MAQNAFYQTIHAESVLQEFVKKQIAPYKYPRRVEFLDALPRTETGKIQRFKLRKLEIERVEGKKIER